MSKTKVMAVLGSGGHTTEMLAMINALDKEKYSPKTFVYASTDLMTVKKLASLPEQDFKVSLNGSNI